MLLEIHNLRGMNEFLKLKFRKGYKEQIQVAYEIPYLTKNKRHGLETEFSYFKKNETEYNTINDKLVFYRNDNSYALKYYRGSISYKYRYKHYTHHRFSIGYYHGFIHDSIILLNPNYFDKALNTQKYFNVEYSLNINKTNIHYYPLEGYHFYTGIQQAGLGLLENEMNRARNWYDCKPEPGASNARKWWNESGGSVCRCSAVPIRFSKIAFTSYNFV